MIEKASCEFEGTPGFDATGVLALTPVFGFSRDVSISGGEIRPFRVVRQMQPELIVDEYGKKHELYGAPKSPPVLFWFFESWSPATSVTTGDGLTYSSEKSRLIDHPLASDQPYKNTFDSQAIPRKSARRYDFPSGPHGPGFARRLCCDPKGNQGSSSQRSFASRARSQPSRDRSLLANRPNHPCSATGGRLGG